MVDTVVPDNILDLIEKDGSVPKFMAKQMSVELKQLRSLYRANAQPSGSVYKCFVIGYKPSNTKEPALIQKVQEARKALAKLNRDDIRVVLVDNDEFVDGIDTGITVLREWP